MLAAAAGVALLIALVWVLPSGGGVPSRTVQPARVARRDPASGVLRVANRGRLPAGAATVTDVVGGRPVEATTPWVLPGATRTVRYDLPTTRRGRYELGPLTLTRTDPLGLLRRQTSAAAPGSLLVHPRLLPVAAGRLGTSRAYEGATADSALEGSIVFQSLREYVVGDDMRRVHWKTSARTGTLMVKQHVDTLDNEVVLLLDDRRSPYASDEDLEQAVDVAASMGDALRGAAVPCRVRTVSGTPLAGGESPRDRWTLLEGLAELPVDTTSGPAALGAALSRLPAASGLVLVTGALAGDQLESLRLLGARVLVLCVTPAAMPQVPGQRLLAAPDATALLALWGAAAGR